MKGKIMVKNIVKIFIILALGLNILIANNNESTMKLDLKECDAGDGLTCFNIAMCYEQGRCDNFERNQMKANIFYQKACDNGSFRGCWKIGFNYHYGQGVIKNTLKATEFYKKACDGNDGMGCLFLGIMYKNGEVFKQNNQEALSFFKKACDLKSPEGCADYSKLKQEMEK